MTKIPVGKTITHAYSFTFGELGAIIGLCWVPLVLMAVLQFLPYALGGNPLAPPENAAAQGRHALESSATSLVLLLLYSIMYVPVMRQALGLRKGSAVVHFALGPAEFRVFGALCLFFILMMMMAVGVAVLGLVLSGLSLVIGKNALTGLIFAVLILAAVLGFIYAIVRLGFLLVPVTVAEEKISLTRGWLLTRDNFWRIFAVMLAVLVPVYLAHLVGLIVIVGPQLFAPIPSSPGLAEQIIASRFALVGQHMPEYLGLTLILAPFSIGLGVGAAAFAYRMLTQPSAAGGATS